MIKIIVKREGNNITTISASGHALSADHRKDLVCAGVSSIMFGFMNSFDKTDVEIKMTDEPYIEINAINNNNNKTSTLFKALYTSLKTMEQSNKQFINIKEK